MKKLFFISIIFLALFACKSEKKENNEIVKSDTISVPEMTVAEFYEKAPDYRDKEVIVVGIVDHVCKHGGKKLLLVQDSIQEGVHVTSDERFDENLTGSEVKVQGIVRAKVIDEAYCQKLEEENQSDDHEKSNVEEVVKFYRDSMQKAGVDSLVFYSLEFVKFPNQK